MRLIPLAAAVAAFLVPAAPAFAGDPTMPLWQVHAGMQCTGYSVIQGTTISSFDVAVVDVTGGEATGGGGRILVQVSGPAVDATGIGPGFSGTPIYCPDGAGVSRVIGAISESINEYGGKAALATPIESILATPVDVPGKPNATAARAKASSKLSPRMRAALASAKPIVSPLSVSGLSGSIANALVAAGAKAGRPVLAVPPGPLSSFPPQTLRPGSAVAVGYSNGDVRTSSVGTVSYVDGDRVWVFGHQLEGAGRRALLLQDAYVFRIVNNPLQLGQIGATYKLAASGHDLGTVTSDGFSAVAGRTGALPHTVPVQAHARDEDSNTVNTVRTNAADEAAVDLPSGGSWTSFVAPLAVSQAAANVLGSTPGRLTGEMCAKIAIAELTTPVRFCNRYVSNAISQADDGSTVNAVDERRRGRPRDRDRHDRRVHRHAPARQRDQRLAQGAPRHRPGVHPQRADAGAGPPGPARACAGRAAAGPRRSAHPDVHDARPLRRAPRLPARALRRPGRRPGRQRLHHDHHRRRRRARRGRRSGPGQPARLEAQIRATARYDGVSVRIGRARGQAFRDDDFRISGLGATRTRVTGDAR